MSNHWNRLRRERETAAQTDTARGPSRSRGEGRTPARHRGLRKKRLPSPARRSPCPMERVPARHGGHVARVVEEVGANGAVRADRHGGTGSARPRGAARFKPGRPAAASGPGRKRRHGARARPAPRGAGPAGRRAAPLPQGAASPPDGRARPRAPRVASRPRPGVLKPGPPRPRPPRPSRAATPHGSGRAALLLSQFALGGSLFARDRGRGARHAAARGGGGSGNGGGPAGRGASGIPALLRPPPPGAGRSEAGDGRTDPPLRPASGPARERASPGVVRGYL